MAELAVDSLGGILIDGMLGNPIGAQNHLYWELTPGDIVVEAGNGGSKKIGGFRKNQYRKPTLYTYEPERAKASYILVTVNGKSSFVKASEDLSFVRDLMAYSKQNKVEPQPDPTSIVYIAPEPAYMSFALSAKTEFLSKQQVHDEEHMLFMMGELDSVLMLLSLK